jgi:hypothetical protein
VLHLRERHEAAEVLVVHVERGVGGDVRGEDGAVRSVETIARIRRPVRQMSTSVEPVDQAVLGDIAGTGEHCHSVGRCAVFLQQGVLG